MRKIKNLKVYSGVLPYSSEMFGVYQPVLGWNSKRIKDRIKKGFDLDKYQDKYIDYERHAGRVDVEREHGRIDEIRTRPGVNPNNTYPDENIFLNEIRIKLPNEDDFQDGDLDAVLNEDHVEKVLNETVTPKVMRSYQMITTPSFHSSLNNSNFIEQQNAEVVKKLKNESSVAGYLLHLKKEGEIDTIKDIIYGKGKKSVLELPNLESYTDPFDLFDPKKDIDRVSLSPLGIIHLFRQYFFEFDTFLGSPVEHVWLSPGATVELMEVSTRKTIIENTFERFDETITTKDQSITEEDEISSAIKLDNQSNTKFGMNASGNQGWIGGSASTSASIDIEKTQSKAREISHKHMREQSDKLSVEIRKNFKSTFKSFSEETDLSSKRYVLSNTTDSLINYEMRRKMRQVGVQVQDVGTYMCWQTFVDDPGFQLGVSELVHIAKKPEVGNVPPPESIPMPQPIFTEHIIDIPFIQKSGDRGDLDEGFKHGTEVDEDFNEGAKEKIQADFKGNPAFCSQSGFQFESIFWELNGNDVRLSTKNIKGSKDKITFDIHLDYINFRGNSPIQVTAKIKWVPQESIITEINDKNKAMLDNFSEKEKLAFETAFIESARDRINVTSNITPRKFAELREEERIVVYRKLIQEMLTKKIPMPDDRTRHVVSELLNTIFDIDKMLYFVAPEWWRPRLHQSEQALGADVDGEDSEVLDGVASSHTVSWGGAGEGRADNYYITEESRQAKFGSSLGWLLQLDGDDMRNAFLNAPWVKAVIPVRPGKERAAMNWLQQVEVEGIDGLKNDYVAPAEELAKIPHTGPKPTVLDAIYHLCDSVKSKHDESFDVSRYPKEEINDDNRVSSTPIDKVYEHGFYPLQGGFRAQPGDDSFDVFDQWIEILPTEQIVPVEVSYDPKTGRQI